MDTRNYKNACNSTKQYSQGAPVCSTEIIIILILATVETGLIIIIFIHLFCRPKETNSFHPHDQFRQIL